MLWLFSVAIPPDNFGAYAAAVGSEVEPLVGEWQPRGVDQRLMKVRRRLRTMLGVALIALVSCTTNNEEPVSSSPARHPELIVESGRTPSGINNLGLLVEDQDGLEWAWSWFGLAGAAPAPTFKTDAVLFLAITESGSCPIEYRGFEIVGATVEIQSDTKDGRCTADAQHRSIVLRLPTSDLPDGDLRVGIDGDKLGVRRLSSKGRWLREAILRWFEKVPEGQLPERGVLGGKMEATVVAFPSDFAGKAEDDFLVLLEDGHIVDTYRYRLTTSLFWRAGDLFRHGVLPWKRLATRRGFEVWKVEPTGFVPFH